MSEALKTGQLRGQKKKNIRTKEDWKEDSDKKITCTVHLQKEFV